SSDVCSSDLQLLLQLSPSERPMAIGELDLLQMDRAGKGEAGGGDSLLLQANLLKIVADCCLKTLIFPHRQYTRLLGQHRTWSNQGKTGIGSADIPDQKVA